MKNKLTATLILLGSIQASVAQDNDGQWTIGQPGGRSALIAQQEKEAQDIVGQYKIQRRNDGAGGRERLEKVHAIGLSKTPENVKAIRSLLSSDVTIDEKVALVRILGDLHTYDDKSGMNREITNDLRGVVYSGHKDVARESALVYSRLGYFADSQDVLLYSKNAGLINADEYYGEFAHLVPYAPANDQINLASKIKNGNNRYATEILAFTFQNSEVMKKVSPEAQRELLAALETNEPEFSQPTGEFSFVDAVRYSTWLQTIAVLNSTIRYAKYEDVVLAHLNDKKTDPRKVMAFLISAEGKMLFQKIGKDGAFDGALDRIENYYKQNSSNITIHEVVKEIANTVKSVMG